MRTRLATRLALSLALSLVASPGIGQSGAPQYARTSDVIYGRKAGLALTLEVLTPAKPNRVGVVWVVSSSGKSSREQTLDPSFEKRISPLLQRGYTVFAVIHGSSPAFNALDYIEDVRRAVRFVRHRAADFLVEGKRLGIGGSSSGGAIALTVAMRGDDGNVLSDDPVDRVSSRVQAVGCFFPPTDFLNFGEPAKNLFDALLERGVVDPSFQFYEADPKTGARTLLTNQENILQILRDISPVTHVSADDPPTILIHGDADKAVPLQQSHRMMERLKAANVAARLIVRPGMRHAWPGWEADSELIAQWFGLHLPSNPAR